MFLEHSVVILEPNHSLICQLPFFQRQALRLQYHICAPSQLPAQKCMGQSLVKGLLSFLIFLETERAIKSGMGQMMQQPGNQLLALGRKEKKSQAIPGYTQLSEAANERASRKTLEVEVSSRVYWLRQRLNSCMQAGMMRDEAGRLKKLGGGDCLIQ